jgi:PKD domain/Secretion system C-terminal sorting domain
MERNEQDIFDQLVREKLSGYTEPPEPAWIKNIHAKKGRVINLYHLYRLMMITALVGAGIFASVQFAPNNIESANSQPMPQNTLSSQSADVQAVDYSAIYSSDQPLTPSENTGIHNTSSVNQNRDNQTWVKPTTKKSTGENKQTPSSRATSKTTKQNAVKSKDKASAVVEPYLIEAPKATVEDKSKTSSPNKEELKEEEGEDVSSNCDASFEYYTSYTGEINFSNTSSVPSKSTITWSFGDGIGSDEREPVHQFRTTGLYDVTLYVKDVKSGCEDRLTKTIAYKNPNDKTTPITINGELYAGTTPVKNGWVELYRYDTKRGGFLLTNTIRTSQSGSYSVNINRNERYLLKGIPSNDMRDYNSAFWGNTESIENATEIVVMPSEEDNLLGYNIELALGEKQPTETDIKEPIASNSDQNVLLLDGNNNVVGVGTVDAKGNYTFSGSIPPGDYKVLNPATGVSTAKTVLTGGSRTVGGSIFEKGGETAAGSGTEEKVSVFPNPASNTVNFGINSTSSENATIILMNAAGVELSRKQVTFTLGFNQTQYDLTNYSPGIYYVLVFKGNQQVLSNRLVKMADTSK